MLSDVVHLLRCPVCGDELALEAGTVACPRGHSFDLARQGYVSLLADRLAAEGDTAAMVSARAAFLDRDLFEPLTAGLIAAVRATDVPGCVVDVGAGPGHHLARVLDALPRRSGVALDSSKAAMRRAARAHPRAGAIVCDAWRELPLRDGVAAVVLSVLAPRNGPEFARVLAPGGTLVAVTPTPDHLAELVSALGLLTVPEDKEHRLSDALEPHLALAGRELIEDRLELSREEAAAAVRMGPSAWHLDEASADARLADLGEPVAVTVSLALSRYRHA